VNRPNRFIATVEVNETIEKAHVKNTGRLGELLREGEQIYLEDHSGNMKKRKLKYSLIAVKKGEQLVNIDSQAPNRVVKEGLMCGEIVLPGMEKLSVVKGEYRYGESRLDFYVEDIKGKKGLVEVKGVTLEAGGTALFPDAPTERGVRHIGELIKASKEGYAVYVIFVIKMKNISNFRPNDKTHPEFGDALRAAYRKGVEILAYDCVVEADSLIVDEPVDVVL